MKPKLQKVNTDQLQDQKKKSHTNSKPSVETKNKFKMEIEIKKPGQFKQKAQAPIGPAGRVHMNTEVISERPGSIFKLLLAKFDAVSSPIKSPMGISKQSNAQQNPYKDPIV